MDWFLKLPQMLQVSLLLSIFIIFLFSIKEGIKFSFGKISISFRKNKNENENKEINPHYGCKNFDDIYIVILKLTDLLYKKAQLESGSDLLRKQMEYAEMKINKIIGIFQKHYLTELESLEKECSLDKTTNLSYSIFRLILVGFVRRGIETQLRCYFKKERIMNVADKEYKYVRDEAISAIILNIMETFNVEYFYNDLISKEKLYEINKKHQTLIEEELEDVFDMASNFYKDNFSERNRINDEMAKLMSRGQFREL